MADLQIPTRELAVILGELKSALDLPGDVVEFGCYAGNTSIELAKLMQDSSDKWLWLYDSFEGLPPKTAEDNSTLGWRFQAGELKISPISVSAKFKKFKLPEPVIKKAWFDDLDPASDLPDQICFALLDGDFYKSIQTSLDLVSPKLTSGATVIVHDYRNPALPGSAKAVNEFISSHPEYQMRLSGTLAILRKPNE